MPTVTEAKNREKAKPTTAAVAPKPKAPTPAATLPDFVPAWDQYPELKQLNFGSLLEQRTRLKDEIKFRESKIRDMDTEIEAALAVAGAEKVTWEDRPVQVVQSNSGAKISAQKLLMNGVPAGVIADSTEPGKAYSYLLVGKPGK